MLFLRSETTQTRHEDRDLQSDFNTWTCDTYLNRDLATRILGYVPHHEDRDLESGLQGTRLNTWMLTHQLQVVEVRVGRRFPFLA